jgi:hypothetical protein
MIEGIGVTFGNGVSAQQAIEHAGRRYFELFDQRPTHVALPVTLDPKSLELWTLTQVAPYGSTNVVIVGHIQDGDQRRL